MDKTKARTEAAKRRAKRAIAEIEQIPRKRKNGRTKQPDGYVSDRNPLKTVLTARARLMASPDADAMRNPALSEPAGRAIFASRKGEAAARLWGVYKAFSASYLLYMRRYVGCSPYAKTAKIEMMPESYETRPDDRPDLRSEDEKVADAKASWARWDSRMNSLPHHFRWAIYHVLHGRHDPVEAGHLTMHGQQFILAMEKLADISES